MRSARRERLLPRLTHPVMEKFMRMQVPISSELEQVARSMDAPELGIEQAADLYERAGALHRAAAERLAQVQGRLEALRRQDDSPS